MTSRAVPALALLALALLGVAGCGGSGGDDGVASASGGRASASPSAKPSLDPRDAQLKFAQCMRQNGVNVPDPKPGQTGVRIAGGKGDLPRMEAARKKCQPLLEAGGLGQGPQDPKIRDRQLKFAQCMRQHGINVPDPQPGQPLTIRQREGDRARFEAAQKACAQYGPRGPRQAGDGPGAGQ